MLSSGAGSDAPIVTAGRMLAERGVFGLAWLDADLVVSARYGRLVEFIEIGVPVTDSVFALVGLEDDMRGLCEKPGAVLELPLVSQAMLTASGEVRSVRLTFTAIWSPMDHAVLLLAARAGPQSDVEIELSRQMRARLMAEAELAGKSRELERLNAELVAANDDLDSYASIISHDLGQPMRACRDMTGDLRRHLDSGDLAGARGVLNAIDQQTRRMSEMLSGLLEYSSVTRKSELHGAVDTKHLIEAVVHSLGVPPSFKVSIDGDWPVIETVAVPLDLVLRNLIDNAIKHHDRAAGRIVAMAVKSEKYLEISISDDGKGIAPELREAAFLPFRKLAGAAPTGHGLGLALVKKTVERSGGSIRVQSAAPAGRGTTFTVFWPLGDAN